VKRFSPFFFYATPSEEAIKKILSFLSLPDGWCYGNGVAPAPTIAISAIAIYSFLKMAEVSSTDAFPGEDGRVLVTGYSGDYTIEVYCETSGTFKFVLEKGENEISVEPCDSTESVRLEINKKAHLWNRSRDCSIQNTMTKQRVGTEVRRFSPPAMEAGRPLLTYCG
jgi:hypothetical protein